MAKIVQLRDTSDDKLAEKLEDNREEMFNLRFQKASARLKNYTRIKQVRREIAQIETVRHNRQQAIAAAAAFPALAEALQGQTWQATARFSYEDSAWLVEFKNADGRSLASAQVNLNARRSTRRAARQGQTGQIIRSYKVNG